MGHSEDSSLLRNAHGLSSSTGGGSTATMSAGGLGSSSLGGQDAVERVALVRSSSSGGAPTVNAAIASGNQTQNVLLNRHPYASLLKFIIFYCPQSFAGLIVLLTGPMDYGGTWLVP